MLAILMTLAIEPFYIIEKVLDFLPTLFAIILAIPLVYLALKACLRGLSLGIGLPLGIVWTFIDKKRRGDNAERHYMNWLTGPMYADAVNNIKYDKNLDGDEARLNRLSAIVGLDAYGSYEDYQEILSGNKCEVDIINH